MKSIRLSLVIALASLGLVACDYRDETTTTASPQASTPDDTVLNPSATTTTASGPLTQQPTEPLDATPAPVEPTTTAEAPAPGMPMTSAEAPAPGMPPMAATDAGAPPLSPDTSAMGAQPGTPAALGAPAGAGTVASDGVAAPTELARFMEESAVKADAKAGDTPAANSADKTDQAGKAGAS